MGLKRIFIFVLIVVLLGLLAYYYPNIQSLATGKSISINNQEYQPEPAFVTRIVDGDTIHVNINGTDETIRLLGINTPEKNKPEYQEAKDYLINEIENKSVELLRDTTDTDKYGRKLRYVFYNNIFIDAEIIQQGLATTFMIDELKYKDKLNNSETFARNNGIGMWKKSTNACATCIRLEKLDPKNEFFIINNSCSFDCNLAGWLVKDDANHFFYLENLNSNEKREYISSEAKDSNKKPVKTDVWNNDHDRFFMRDEEGNLVIFYEY